MSKASLKMQRFRLHWASDNGSQDVGPMGMIKEVADRRQQSYPSVTGCALIWDDHIQRA